jgi:hypothetical protein
VRAAFAPNYTITVNAGGTGIPTGLTSGAANLNWTIKDPAGAAVSSYTSVSGITAMTTAEQFVTGAAVPTLGTTGLTSSSSLSSIKGTVAYFPTATAGTYTITVWHDANRNDLQDAYEAVTTSTYTVVADGLPSITFTKYGSTTPAQAAAGSFGMLVKVSLRNGTTAVSLAENETLVLTGATGTVFDMKSEMAGVTGTTFAMADATNNTTVSIPFTAGAENGSTITSYTITSSPSISLTYSGTTSPMTVTGSFVQNQAYTFTVIATNGVGSSSASSASNSITPYVAVASAGAISTQPTGAVSGSALATQPVIRIVDAAGNTVINSTVNVVATIASGTGELSGTTTVAAVAGREMLSENCLSGFTAGPCGL